MASNRKLRALVGALTIIALVGLPVAPATATHGTACLDLTLETPATNRMGVTHVITATLRSPGQLPTGNPLFCEGPEVERGFDVYIDFEVSPASMEPGSDPEEPNADSPTTPDLTCTITPGTSSCTASYLGTDPGRDFIRGWIDEDGNHSTSPPTHGTFEGDSTEGRNEQSATGVGTKPEPDDTDVVQKKWGANLDCYDADRAATPEDPSDDETDTNPVDQGHVVTCKATDNAGNPEANQQIDMEITGANDPDGADSKGSPDRTCTTVADGTCSMPAHVGSDEDGDPGTSTYRAWHDTDRDNTTTDWDATEGRDESAQPGDVPEPDFTDVLEKTWVPAAGATLDCDDESGDDIETNRKGQAENYRCIVRDADANPVAGAFVDGENLSGVNDPDQDPNDTSPANTSNAQADPNDYTCGPTNAQGICNISVPGEDPNQAAVDKQETGTALICFWVDSDNAAEGSESFNMEGSPEDGGRCDQDKPSDPAAGEQGPPTDEPEQTTGLLDESDTVSKTWQPSDVDEIFGGLDARPDKETSDTYAEKEDALRLEQFRSITATVYDQFGQPVEGKRNLQVNFEFFQDSPSDQDSNTPVTPDQSCTLGDASDPNSTPQERASCSIRYRPQPPRQKAGRDLVCVWHGTRPPTMAGTNTNGLCEGEGHTDPTADDGTPSPTTDRVDVVEKWWAATFLDCGPETPRRKSGTAHTIECTATNQAKQLVSGQNIDIEARGDNDPDGTNSDSRQSPDFTCTTDSSGKCSVTHTGARAGTTTYIAWIDADQNNQTSEADEEPVGAPENDNDTDWTTVSWTASRLDCNPETASNPRGTTHTITCRATDAGGFGVSGVEIDGEATGAGDPDGGSPDRADLTKPDFECVPATDSNGNCTFTHSSAQSGTTVYRFWIDDDDDNTTADADATEGRDADANPPNPAQQGEQPEPDDTDVVEKNWVGPGLDCTPETDENATGTSHEITCVFRNSQGRGIAGEEIDGEATGAGDPDGGSPDRADLTKPDFTGCTTSSDDPNTQADEGGICRYTHSSGDAGNTTYRFWVDSDKNNATVEADRGEARDETTPVGAGDQAEPDNTDVVEKTWVTFSLNCEPETDSNPTGTSHTVSCEARDTRGIPLSGANIDIEATGANDPDASDPQQGNSPETPDFTCTTDRTGVCTFTHGPGSPAGQTTSQPGQTLYRAWIDTDGNHSANPPTHGVVEADRTEGRAEGTTPGSKSEPDDTDVVEKNWIPQRLNCEPEADANPTGTQHTVTCTVTTGTGSSTSPVQGANVDVEATGANDPDGGDSPESPDFTCTTDNNGNCSFTHGPGGTGRTTDPGTTTYRAWVDVDKNNATVEADRTEGRDEGTTPGSAAEPDGTDVVEKTWQAPPIDCSPEVDGNPSGTAHTVTCSAAPNTNIDVEATGANDPDGGDSKDSPDFTCRTGADGRCTFTHGPGGTGTTASRGTTIYRAWIDADGNHSANPPTHGAVEADATEGRNETTQPGSKPEPDDSDVVEKNWTAEVRSLTMTPERDSAAVGTCNPFTINVLDAANQGVQGVIIDVEQRHERSLNQTPNDEPTVAFCTPSSAQGPNPSGVDQTRGDLDPPEENPDNRGTLGGETIEPTDAQGRVTIGIRVDPGNGSDGTGNVELVAFVDSDDDHDPDSTEVSDGSTKTWIEPAGRTIDCEPSSSSAPVRTEHEVVCTVLDSTGQPVQGEDVTFTEEGPGEFVTSSQTTTNQSGQASVTVTSDEEGAQTITGTLTADIRGNEPGDVDECDKPAGDPQGAPPGTCSDSVTHEWTRAQVPRPCRDPKPGFNVIIGTSGPDTLVGTPGKDLICGGGGDDDIRGRGGRDLIFGNGGDDTLRGGAGNDRISGNRGNDVLRGGPGKDTLLGGRGNDSLRGGAGSDVLDGGGGTDRCDGRKREDSFRRCE